jgi:glycosyltransferase involved in cell wall biosynthesis
VMGTPPAGILVPPGDPEALAQGILQVLTQPGLAEAITKLGTERAPEYDWNELAKIVETAYLRSQASPKQLPNN